MQSIADSETTVPENETPAARCPYCRRPFRSDRLYALHLGHAHWDDCTDAERDAYEGAYDAESDDLFVFHLKVIAALVLIYVVFTVTYAAVWS